MTNAAHEDLLDTLDVKPLGGSVFVGPVAHRTLPRVFGGQVLAQALVAAGRTVPDRRPPNSLHAYFLAGGDPAVPIVYRVDTLRDGRSFSSRQVTAEQGDRRIFTMLTSFAAQDDGLDHQCVRPGGAPEPGTLAGLHDRLAPERALLPAWWTEENPFDIRFIDHPTGLATGSVGPARQSMWIRSPHIAGDDPTLHAALVAYASDLTLLDPALMPHGRSWYGTHLIDGASIDHALWFHRPARADQWLLCQQRSPVAHGGRCLCTAEFFDVAGALVGSVAQEGVLRERRTASSIT
ncbi:acyl-CoA thioesterase II [Rhodococcoides trifolii]|uniref:Acyl-CoA thioesterase II n=1 Tax=Rhodococcoides trifolii TaxID=908250 RepID=A0A917G9J5_9NOCA|nr:acyl-CoA thioesterase II [Rhodococcus trifolii]GGG29972.1 acyl-CoA thioesterase II [Rhodococcus trifolii]